MWRLLRGTSPCGLAYRRAHLRLLSTATTATTNESATSSATTGPSADGDDGDVITPWHVAAKGPKGIDYHRVLEQFRSESISPELLERFQRVVVKRHEAAGSSPPPLHPLLRRGTAFSHRDLNTILDELEANKTVYLYTGRGPSASTMHVGHVIPFVLTKYLQDALMCPLVVQITDDEKFLFRDIPLPTMDKMCHNNIKDIIAFGFDPSKTFIFRNSQYMGDLYPTVLEVQRCITVNAAKNTFGLNDSDNVGKMAFVATQAAPAFVSAFRRVLPIKGNNMKCLIPCAIDQDPFFVLTRGLSDRIKRPKPALIHTKFLPALKGVTHKMSSSAESNGVILLTDDDATVLKKMKKAFSGGGGTLADLQANGPNLDCDVAFKFIEVFASSDALVQETAETYRRGTVHSGHVKELAAKVVIDEILTPWRRLRATVSDESVAQFSSVRNILSPSGAKNSGPAQ